MPKTIQQKLKLLALWDILTHRTDENNALSTDEIITLLAEKGIEVSRKVLPSDIAVLNDNGYEVLSYKKRCYYYYVVSRPLDTAEASMLADVVQASKLTPAQKKLLLHKLSEASGVTLKNIIYCDTIKRSNSHILYSIDKIERAINAGRQISFKYFSLDHCKKKVYHRNGTCYTVNPLVMVWSRDNYYLICYDDKHDGTANYRIDRMERVEIEETMITPRNGFEKFNVEDYRRQIFSMFGGELVNVQISFPEDLLDDIYDKFGENVSVCKTDKDKFMITVPVQISPTFFTWIIGSCGKLQILSPREVRQRFSEFVNKIKDSY